MSKTNQSIIYFDNAATSWPKPVCMLAAMQDFLEKVGANPGRSGHSLSIKAGKILLNTRKSVAELFDSENPLNVVFTYNATEGLNIALRGILNPGDHVITSSLEHNSMMRPLRCLETKGVRLTIVKCSPQGFLDPDDLKKSITSKTKLIALNHASNVSGTLLPIAAVGQIARAEELLFLVDTAQTGGAFPINMESDRIDLLVFSGHKALYGPTGTGGLIIGKRVDLSKWNLIKSGGTGSSSDTEIQPDFLPDMLESGTPNVMGLAGLNAGINWLLEKGIQSVRNQEMTLTKKMLDGLSSIPEIQIFGPSDPSLQTGTISFNVTGWDIAKIGNLLDERYNIMCRVGLHCSPAAHRTLGTYPNGTIRFGFGIFNANDEIERTLMALKNLIRENR